jgi:regulator of protease activity HflC (stomatin/prohibitin superfamily)
VEEQRVSVRSGWGMLVLAIIVALAVPAVFAWGTVLADRRETLPGVLLMIASFIILMPLAFALFWGLFILQPNEARVLVLFGRYVGTVRESGFHWTNPFSVIRGGSATISHGHVTFAPEPSKRKYRVSLRARNFETQHLKVNDQRGNPVEIAAVVVWRVEDTAKALFDVNDYENYVSVQSETAVRHLASSYPYDHSEEGAVSELTLRGNADAVNATLKQELQDRLDRKSVV